MRRIHLPLFAAVLASVSLVGCGKSGSNIAVVNGEAVSQEEYTRYLERKPLVLVQTQQGAVELPPATPLGFQAVRDLINRRILLQLAKDENVYPTADDVNKELEFQRKRDPQFIQKLQQQGMNIEEIKRDLTLDLAREKLVTKNVTTTPAEADKFIKENPDRFMNPEQAKLRFVAIRDEAKKAQVDKDLASGQPFEQIAVRYSVVPNVRQTQGLFPIGVVSAMPPELQAIVKSTPEGKVSDWKFMDNAWVKFKVEQHMKAKPVVIDDTMKETVRRAIQMDKGSKSNDLQKRIVEKLKSAKIEVTPANLKTRWDEAFKALQDSGGDAAGGASTATAKPTNPQ